MTSSLIQAINAIFGWASKNQTIKPDFPVVKVNLGSGLSVTEGWINIDFSLHAMVAKCPRFLMKIAYHKSGQKRHYQFSEYYSLLKNNVFVHHNLKYGIPFPDNSVDYIYSSHFLEHIPQGSARQLLGETFRVLKSGCTARICVPDLKYVVSLYEAGKKEEFLGYFFGSEGWFDRHCYMYDFELLGEVLRDVGFVNIKHRAFRQGNIPDLDNMDRRPEDTLHVEAMKP